MVILAFLVLALSGCSFQTEAEIVAVIDEPKCSQGKMTLMDTHQLGRIQRCGYWGKVGDKFLLGTI